MKIVKYSLALIIFIVLLDVSAFSKNIASEKQTFERGMKLAYELIEKLEANTPFSFEEEVYFFGKSPNMNLPTIIYSDLGYIKGFNILKKSPKYSFYGELLRLNRELILPSKKTTKVEIFVSKTYYPKNNNKFIEGTSHFLTIFIYMYNSIDNFKRMDEHLISIPFNAIGNCLFEPITVNGKSIMNELGFYHNTENKERRLKKDTLLQLEKHIESLKTDK